jgi:hypothetical protein
MADAEARQEARRIIHDLARAIDRKLEVEVRDVTGQDRLQVSLTQAGRHGHIELGIPTVLASTGDAVARNELRLRIKRAADTLRFRPMPDHRLTVKPLPPPGGHAAPRGGVRGSGRGRR